ncbi:hypothetical protein BEH_07360 [Priestia filamentosa]|uniref:FtsK domain-containing protein n=1 Tax=Priestia filamentosa TaxID=1402861 RepID=A0A0H4KUF7_9BACI|nr:FtsK/SpoIIIE domain-containing protein [Priestia filamentosa]AKO91933.1 hypothetical protein BEH_07360 [Priestia filamentosa]
MNRFLKKQKLNYDNLSRIEYNLSNFDSKVSSVLSESFKFDSSIISLETLKIDSEQFWNVSVPCHYKGVFHERDIGEELPFDFSSDSLVLQVKSTQPSFLPFYAKDQLSLFEDLNRLYVEGEIFTQLLLIKRTKAYNELLIELYENYLNGNDIATTNKILNAMQTRILRKLGNIVQENFERTPDTDIEDKVTDSLYEYEWRIVINSKFYKTLLPEIEEILKQADFHNQFELQTMKKFNIDLIRNRTFSNTSHLQVFSQKELDTLFLSTSNIPEVETKPIPVIEKVDKEHPIHLLPDPEVKKERERDESELKTMLSNALRRVKATNNTKIQYIEIEQGVTVERIVMKIPKDTNFTNIQKKLVDLQAQTGTDMNIERGKEPDTVTFLIPCEQREVVYLKELLQNEEFLQFAQDNPLPFVAGVDMYNKPLYRCLTKAPHLLVAGATGGGKSVFINALLITLILTKSPEQLRLYLIDPKHIELEQYKGISHVEDVITDMKKAYNILESLVIEMDKRYELMAKNKCKSIKAFNKKSGKYMPYIVVVVDEYNDLKMVSSEVESQVERLGQKARGCGIHLILATQKPSADVLTGTLKANLPSRISFKLSTSSDYKTVFGKGIPYNLLGKGDGVLSYDGQMEDYIRLQSPVITLNEDEEEMVYEKIQSLYRGKYEELELSEPESLLDKMKRIIANTNETRVGELRKQMKIRINDVQDLMQQLVDEKWLTKEDGKRGYQLIATEEELSQWRD